MTDISFEYISGGTITEHGYKYGIRTVDNKTVYFDVIAVGKPVATFNTRSIDGKYFRIKL